MNDFVGNELNAGDNVIYVHYSPGSQQCLVRGEIKCVKTIIGRKVAYMFGSMKGVTSQNIYKV